MKSKEMELNQFQKNKMHSIIEQINNLKRLMKWAFLHIFKEFSFHQYKKKYIIMECDCELVQMKPSKKNTKSNIITKHNINQLVLG